LDSRQGQICPELEVARTVLVVDDDPLVLEVTADMLKDLGCEVVAAASGMDAIERLLENANIEILVTDLNMPGMDGYELVERATAARPGLQVIMLSGREIDGRGWPVVRKPFLEEDLAHTMKQNTGLC
jgi:two-component system, cell cycle response regulator CpdR